MDGVALSLDGSSGTLSGNTMFRYLGVNYNTNTQWFEGGIDELAAFDYTLDAGQVTEIYNATSTGKTADLSSMATPPVAWYRMGD